MNEIIFSLNNISKIKLISNENFNEILNFGEIFSTIPMCKIVENVPDVDCTIEIRFVNQNEIAFKYNKSFTKFKVFCEKSNYYPPDITFLMLCVFASKLQNKGYYLIHSSAMNINNKGVLFVGPSGSGKTNISLILAKNEHGKYISGDMTLVRVDTNQNKVYLVGGTTELTAFDTILNKLFNENKVKNLQNINSKKLLDSTFLKNENIEFENIECELKLIVNIRGGTKLYIKKAYDFAECLIKVEGMISEWIRCHSNFIISTNSFFPDMDNTSGMNIRKAALNLMSNIKQFSVYGPYEETAKMIAKELKTDEF